MQNVNNNKEGAKEPLVILAGPTAVGKTALSIDLARSLDGEIISADSMQVYRYMDIGSAKISAKEMGGIPHHLIDVLDPRDEFNVVIFQRMAREAIAGIRSHGKIPILTGGTGFYIQSVLYDIDFLDNPEDTSIRQELEQFAAAEGAERLHDRLMQVDPEAAEQIHANNVKRVIRALEFFMQTGQKISGHNEQERARASAYNSCYFVLTDERQLLYEQIERRVDAMLEAGLVDEVRRLKEMGCSRELVSMQGLGYKEIFAYLEGECTLEESAALIKRDTRHFAKRQLTWFRRERDVIWVDKQIHTTREECLARMLEVCRERGICHDCRIVGAASRRSNP